MSFTEFGSAAAQEAPETADPRLRDVGGHESEVAEALGGCERDADEEEACHGVEWRACYPRRANLLE